MFTINNIVYIRPTDHITLYCAAHGTFKFQWRRVLYRQLLLLL